MFLPLEAFIENLQCGNHNMLCMSIQDATYKAHLAEEELLSQQRYLQHLNGATHTQQNGVTKRRNKTILNMVGSMLAGNPLEKTLGQKEQGQ